MPKSTEITTESRSKSADALREMRQEHLLSELDELRRVMAKKSTTLVTIERVISTIRKLRLSVEGPIESANRSETEVKTKIPPCVGHAFQNGETIWEDERDRKNRFIWD